jgi:hypothetical protein
MNDLQIILCCCFFIGGPIVIGTYLQLYWAYTHTYSELDKRKVWSVWYHRYTAWILILSASLSAMGFLYFSIYWIIETEVTVVAWWGVLVYGLFLLSSSFYGPLLALDHAQWKYAWVGVIIDLFIVACSTIALCIWNQFQISWTDAPLLNLSITWLAVHCTILDLFVWGYAWSNGWIWPETSYESSFDGIVLTYSMHNDNGDSIGYAYENPSFMIRNV